MSKTRLRWTGVGMTALAVFVLTLAYSLVAPAPLQAAACCQECEAQEAACYGACDAASHGLDEDDTTQSCYDNCIDALYYQSYGCWTHCTWCGSGTSTCYTFVVQHNYECGQWLDGVCQWWNQLPGPGHVLWSYPTGEHFCSVY